MSWQRLLLTGTLIAFVVLAAAVVLIYGRLKTVSLEDIRQRHEAGETSAIDAAGTGESVPPAMQQPLDKAQQMTDKPIKLQDAVDFAAVLAQSKLSAKDIQDLYRATESELGPEELRRVREMLLSKLTQEEIDTLRAIARSYGKKLDILDPNVPIGRAGDDAAGGSNPAGGNEGQKSPDNAQVTPPANSAAGAEAQKPQSPPPQQLQQEKPKPQQPKDEAKLPNEPAGQQGGDSPPADADSEQAHAQARQRYEKELNALKAECEAEAVRLAGELSELVRKNGEGDAPAAGKLEALAELGEAEARCDQSFAAIVKRAEDEYARSGWDTKDIASWRGQYEAAKESMRAKALQQLGKAAG